MRKWRREVRKEWEEERGRGREVTITYHFSLHAP
jgi:hypothetical protein